MRTVVALYNRLYGAQMSEEQGWMFMAIVKLVRSSRGQLRPDDYEDMAAYAALAGEAAAMERSGANHHDLGSNGSEPGQQETRRHEEKSEPE